MGVQEARDPKRGLGTGEKKKKKKRRKKGELLKSSSSTSSFCLEQVLASGMYLRLHYEFFFLEKALQPI